MDKEKYVTYETAKCLKEKGFDWYCCNHLYCRKENGKVIERWTPFPADRNSDRLVNPYAEYMSAPTQQMAMRWLREEKGIHPELELCTDNEFSFTIYKLDGKRTVLYEEKRCWTNPEDAIEAAILYVLKNLI